MGAGREGWQQVPGPDGGLRAIGPVTGAGGDAGAIRHPEPVMGTVVSFLVYPGELAGQAARAALRSAVQVLHDADAVFSTWKPDSPMSRLRRGEISLDSGPPEIAEVLEACAAARAASGGWFDPWTMPGGVDPTGLVKGWATRRSAEVLRTAGVQAAMVNAGGDIATVGSPPGEELWRVGINHPWQPGALAGVISVPPGGSCATSGDYARPGQIVDPFTSRPVHEVASVTVTGPDLVLADALATACAAGGAAVLERVADLDGYDAYLIGAGGIESATPGFIFVDP